MPVTNVGSRWSSGSLIFYEKYVSRATIGNILTLGTTAVTVGSATQDIDFKVFLGATGSHVVFNVGDGNVVFTGAELRMATTDKIEFRDATNYIHSDAANYLMVNGATGVNLAIGGTDVLLVTSGGANLDGILDLDVSDASNYAVNVLQTGNGGGMYVRNDGTGKCFAVYDSATLKFEVNEGGYIKVYTSLAMVTASGGEFSVSMASAGDPAGYFLQNSSGPALRANRDTLAAGNIFEVQRTGTNVFYIEGDTGRVRCAQHLKAMAGFVVEAGTIDLGETGGSDVYLRSGMPTTHYIFWDCDADTNRGTLYIGSDGNGSDVYLYGETASYRVFWDQNGDTNGTWYFGQDQYGFDVALYGQTASAYVLWDASADDLIFSGASGLVFNGTPTTSISIGACTTGINFSATTPLSGITYGTLGTAKALGDTSSTGVYPITCNLTTATGTGLISSIFGSRAITNAQARGVRSITCWADFDVNVTSVYAGTFNAKRQNTASTVSSELASVVVNMDLGTDTTSTGTGAWGMKMYLKGDNTNYQASMVVGVGVIGQKKAHYLVYVENDAACDNGIRINNSVGTMSQGIAISVGAGITNAIQVSNTMANLSYFLDIAEGGPCVINTGFSGQSAAEPDASIKVNVGGNDLYLYCYPTAVS